MTIYDLTLLGATGFVGQRILRLANEQGVKVEAVSRQSRPSGISESIGWTQADLTKPADIANIPWCQTVISTVQVDMTAQVVEKWIPDPTRRLIAFSSTSALTKSHSAESSDRDLSALLLAGEARLRELHPQVTVLRPTMIYGGTGDRNVERIARQLRTLALFPLIGSGSGLRQPVHVEDLALAAVLAAQSAKARGASYNLGGSEVLTVKQLIQRTAVANSLRVKFVSIPLPLARSALRLLALLPRFRDIPLGSLGRMSQDLIFDSSNARIDFNYSPRAFSPPSY